jgi:thioredoxin reductase (NADPH)
MSEGAADVSAGMPVGMDVDPGGQHETDVIIIGAGPSAIFAVFELGLLGLKAHLVDILDKPGGQCAELYPEKPIYDIPGFPHVTGYDLTDSLMEQAAPFEPVFHFSQLATKFERLADGKFKLTTDVDTEITAPVVLIAAGGGSFTPKKPPLEGLEPYEEAGSIHYAVRKMDVFRGKDILIAGGGDSALDWTIHLAPVAKSVALIHRRDGFRAAPDSVAKMEELVESGKVQFHVAQMKQLNGESGALKSVSVESKTNGAYDIECDMLLPFFGFTMKLGPVANFGIPFNEDDKIEVDTEFFQTEEKGIFAIGDIANYPGKLKLILSSFHEGALFARGAFKTINPDVELKLGYTTSNKALQKKIGA